MDFTLSNEQRSWQMAARKFADEEIRPISLERDTISTRARDLGLGHHQEGLQARLPHHGGAEGMGRPGHRFRHAGAGDDRTRQGRQRHLQGLQPELEMEPSDFGVLHRGAEAALPAGLRRRRYLGARQGHHRAERRLRQPHAAGRSEDRHQAARPSARATSGSSTARRPSSPTRRSASCSSSTRAPIRPCRPSRARRCSWCRATRPASASARCSTRAAGASTRTAR